MPLVLWWHLLLRGSLKASAMAKVQRLQAAGASLKLPTTCLQPSMLHKRTQQQQPGVHIRRKQQSLTLLLLQQHQGTMCR
jgi:hypothetical protein